MENNFNIAAASVSDRGLSEKRPENEDSFLVLRERGLFAVADGVGGAQAGDVASQMAVEILGEAFINQSFDIDAEDVMRAAIERANSAIYQMASDLPQLSSMATTLVALHIDGNIATIGHVGDSRAYRLDHHGNLRRETHDHSVVEEEVRAGRMTPEQALNHPSKNIISRALGAESDVEIDLKTIMVEPGTTFLLCSDGITRHINDSEIGGFLAAESDPADICRGMKDLCYDRGAEDNLTAVIVRIIGEQATQFSTAAATAGAAAVSTGDAEEVTVASPRIPGGESFLDDADDDFSTTETIQTELDDQAYLMDDPNELLAEEEAPDLNDYSSSSVVVPAQPPPPASVATTPVAPSARSNVSSVIEETPAGGSKILSALLFLVLGSLLGAGAYYFLVGPPAEPVVQTPAITEMKSTNAPLTAFEETRRIVDKDPAAYINSKAASMREADDYFWMGRAFLLTGQYWEAKRAFVEARNKLATADPSNAKTLANEISMALAIIESPQATESFTRDITTANSSAASSNSNANTNANSGIVTRPQR